MIQVMFMKNVFATTYFNQFLKFIFKYKLLLLNFLFVVSGLYVGSVASNDSFDYSKLLEGYIDVRATSSFSSVFFSSLFSDFLYLLFLYFSGYFLFGYVICFSFPFIKGLGLGSLLSFSYTSLGLKGIVFSLLCIIPGAFIVCLCLCVASDYSFCMSRLLFSSVFKTSFLTDFKPAIKRYSVKYLFLSLFIVLSSLIFSVSSVLIDDIISL